MFIRCIYLRYLLIAEPDKAIREMNVRGKNKRDRSFIFQTSNNEPKYSIKSIINPGKYAIEL